VLIDRTEPRGLREDAGDGAEREGGETQNDSFTRAAIASSTTDASGFASSVVA
jgi:hypothetical protein